MNWANISWVGILDIIIKIAPIATIIGGLLAARRQLQNNRLLNQETIAKNHYREMLETFPKNTDILYVGLPANGFEKLKQDVNAYRRYRMLFTVMVFAMQELYLAYADNEKTNWRKMSGMFVSMFREFILSEKDFTPYMQASVDPDFLQFMFSTSRDFVHSAATTIAAKEIIGQRFNAAS